MAINISSEPLPDGRRRANRANDDAGLAAFLVAEACKPSVMPYRQYVQQVLEVTASALGGEGGAGALEAELEAAYAVLYDDVSPRDPWVFADAVIRTVAGAIMTDASAEALQGAIDELVCRHC